jgi:FimV-like protein
MRTTAHGLPPDDGPGTGAPFTQHRVAARDTLRAIARSAGARTEPHAQRMMIAIFRANPQAFDGNINLLHLGAVLNIPAEQAVAAIDGVEAKREVRAQMTAWRLEGRPSLQRRLAATAVSQPSAAPAAGPAPHITAVAARIPIPASAPVSVPPAAPAAVTAASSPAMALSVSTTATDALKDRVRMLEQSLEDMHQQLKQLTSRNTAAFAEPMSAPQTAPDPQIAESAAATPAPVPVAAPVHAGPVPAVPVRVEVMRSPTQPAAATTVATPHPTGEFENKTLLGSMAAALSLLLGGFGYMRRRRRYALAPAPYGMADEVPHDEVPLAQAAAGKTDAAAPKKSKAPVKEPPPEPPIVHEIKPRQLGEDTTQSLLVDTEALERSYLDSLGIDSLGIDATAPHAMPTDIHDTAAPPAVFDEIRSDHDTTSTDTEELETVGLETVAIDTSELDTAIAGADVNTVILDTRRPHAAALKHTVAAGGSISGGGSIAVSAPAPQSRTSTADEPMASASSIAAAGTALDYNLLDLDATAQHVQMPSQLNDNVVVSERRTNIVDVLKSAIERDPHRRDLRMKLLETYYSAASINQRAFLEVVRKLAREREFLSTDDWKKVMMMGRDIAAEDILFADPAAKDDDLADCA